MSQIAIFLLALLTTGALAFDPGGAPPAEWTLSATCSFLAKTRMPLASYSPSTLSEVLEGLALDRPRAYRPIYVADDALLASTVRFRFDEKDILVIDLLAKIAEKFGADVVISPGKVTFNSRKSTVDQKKP